MPENICFGLESKLELACLIRLAFTLGWKGVKVGITGKISVPGLRAVGFLVPEVEFLGVVVDPLFKADAFLARPVDLVLLCVSTMLKI